MKCEFIHEIDDETKNDIKNQLGVSDYKNYNIFGIMRTEDMVFYIISVPGPLWPLYMIVEYRGHRYGLFGIDMKIPGQTWWEIRRVDAAYVEKNEMKEMLRLVSYYASYIHYPDDPEYSVTIVIKGYEKMIKNVVEKNAYGINLF